MDIYKLSSSMKLDAGFVKLLNMGQYSGNTVKTQFDLNSVVMVLDLIFIKVDKGKTQNLT